MSSPGADRSLRFEVWGHPIHHSLSPAIHNPAFESFGIRATYGRRDVPPAKLKAAVRTARDEDLAGWNLTVPLKEQILPLLDEVDTEAARIGAVNTVLRRRNGRLAGSNTDARGFIEGLVAARNQPPEALFSGRHVTLLGAGGSARALAFGLAGEASGLRIINRTRGRAKILAADLAIHHPKLQVDIVEADDDGAPLATQRPTDLLVQTTSRELAGLPPLPLERLPLGSGGLVVDIAYGVRLEDPLWTGFLAAAEALGLPTVDGLWMLVGQARLAFRQWGAEYWPDCGELAPGFGETRSHLLEQLRQRAGH